MKPLVLAAALLLIQGCASVQYSKAYYSRIPALPFDEASRDERIKVYNQYFIQLSKDGKTFSSDGKTFPAEDMKAYVEAFEDKDLARMERYGRRRGWTTALGVYMMITGVASHILAEALRTPGMHGFGVGLELGGFFVTAGAGARPPEEMAACFNDALERWMEVEGDGEEEEED